MKDKFHYLAIIKPRHRQTVRICIRFPVIVDVIVFISAFVFFVIFAAAVTITVITESIAAYKKGTGRIHALILSSFPHPFVLILVQPVQMPIDGNFFSIQAFTLKPKCDRFIIRCVLCSEVPAFIFEWVKPQNTVFIPA